MVWKHNECNYFSKSKANKTVIIKLNTIVTVHSVSFMSTA